ncbi:hypothetical protein ACFE04_016014 [Oxalis oulophora]
MKYGKLSIVVESAGTVKSIKADHTSANRDMVRKNHSCGDMVLVRGWHRRFPWWPAQICNEAFAPPSVMEWKEDGYLLVLFFGDNTYGWVKPINIICFNFRHIECEKYSNLKIFVDAVKECEHEISRRAALGLTCKCKNSHNFWPASVEGYLGVDVYGFLGPRGYKIYSIQQTEKSRNQFRPLAMLQFLSSSAVMHGPVNIKPHRDVGWLKDVARLLAYRKAVFSGAKDASILGSEQQPLDLDVIEDLDQQEKVPSPAVDDEQVVIDSHPRKMSKAGVLELREAAIQRNNLAANVEEVAIGSHPRKMTKSQILELRAAAIECSKLATSSSSSSSASEDEATNNSI